LTHPKYKITQIFLVGSTRSTCQSAYVKTIASLSTKKYWNMRQIWHTLNIR